ncbi:26S proteasome regulatory subunit 10B A [Glycine soja]
MDISGISFRTDNGPFKVDPFLYNMLHKDPTNANYSALRKLTRGPEHVKCPVVEGLSDQIRQLRESIEQPLTNLELFLRVGIGMKLPKGVLHYGAPRTRKTLLAKPISCKVDAIFLKVQLLSLCCAKKVLDDGFV